jgi:16S rRNA (guanine527-N7)-methyltransferase
MSGSRKAKATSAPKTRGSKIDPADRAKALALIPVSRETETRLDRFVDLLLAWQSKTNLVAPSTIPGLWTRHVADSLQLLALAPHAKVWIDLGSGGGFPGMPLACALADTPGAVVHLVESNQKKAAFLREAGRVVGAPVDVHAMRIDAFAAAFEGGADVVTARAVAPLEKLLAEAYPLLKTGMVGLFLKGQDIEAELTTASKYWKFEAELAPSQTSAQGRIVVVSKLEKRS